MDRTAKRMVADAVRTARVKDRALRAILRGKCYLIYNLGRLDGRLERDLELKR